MDNFFIDSTGEIVPVPPDQIAGAAQLGWVPASPKQVSDWQLNQKYGTPVEAAKAFGEHALGALTFGLSDFAGDPAAKAAREQANPLASGLGTAAGVAGGLFVPLAGPSLVAKAGKATAKGVAALIPEAETVAGRILAKATSVGAGSAIEGAAYGLGQVVHESALGDPNLTAQSALATIGFSAALGGVFGAGAGGLTKAFGEFAPSDFGKRISTFLETSEGHSNLNATNARPGEIKRVFTQKGEESATKIGLEARDLGIIKNPFTDSPESILERANGAKTTAGKALDTLVSAASKEGPETTWAALDREVRTPIVKALSSKGSTVAIADQFEAVMNRYAQAYAEQPLGLDGLWKLKQDVGDFIYRNGKVLDPWAKELNTPIKRVYDHIDGLIESGLKETGGTEAVTAWNNGNRAFEVSSVMGRLAGKGIERSAENNALHLTGTLGAMTGALTGGPAGGIALGAATELARRRGASALGWAARALRNAIDSGAVEGVVDKTASVISAERTLGADTISATAGNAPEKVATLSLLERLNKSASNKIESTISTLVRGGPRAAEVGRSEVAAGIAKAFGATTEDARATFTKRTESVRQLALDPEQLQNHLTAQTDDWHQHAPHTAQAMQIASARAIAFLSSKLPPTGKAGPLALDPTASRAEISKFTRYYEAVQHPMGLLKAAAAGTLTPEAVEAVKVVYPELYARMRAAAVEKLAGAKGVPYQSKLMLSMLMGQDMDGTTLPMALLRNRMVFARPAQQMAPKPNAKLTLAARMQTPMQESAARRGTR